MKKILAIGTFVAFFIGCKTKETTGLAMEKQRSWEEVVDLATQYGLADTFRNKMATENGLMYFTEKGLRQHFQEERKYYDIRNENDRYEKEIKNFRSVSDYFRLVDSLPIFRIRRYETEENYEKLKVEYLGSNYKFFINEGSKSSSPYLIVVTKPEEMPAEKARPISNR